jgi:hypothetical protein
MPDCGGAAEHEASQPFLTARVGTQIPGDDPADDCDSAQRLRKGAGLNLYAQRVQPQDLHGIWPGTFRQQSPRPLPHGTNLQLHLSASALLRLFARRGQGGLRHDPQG